MAYSSGSGQYVTLRGEGRAELEEKRSRFIGTAAPATSESAATEFISRVKKEFGDATHNVWAYYINGGASARYSDDGEPQGTAGPPVLNVLKMSGATDMAVVVTRYFGGTLLGAGGLVRAYSAGARIALDAAGIAVFDEYAVFTLRASYSDYARIETELPRLGVRVDGVSFDSAVTIRAAVLGSMYESAAERLAESSGGRLRAERTGTRFDF